MRLSKKRWLVWGTSILLVVVIVALGIVQLRQAGQKSDLSEDLELAEQVLSTLETEQSSSGQDETGTQAGDVGTAQAELSQPVDSILANENLFDIANVSSVTLTAITVSPISSGTLAELSCFSLPLNIVAEGDVPDLLDFITRLNTDLTNGLVRSATLSIPETPAEGEPSVDIDLVIYTYQDG
ncbi:MAG: hypothetical protein JSV77_03885 [Dehalococcoidales bacterium]|nr:MAG: hypothetical protein JSV77_03885 [Dehalococcoidales bacterium]